MADNRRRAATTMFALFLVAVVGAGVFVGFAAQAAVLDSQSGSVSEVILDPTAPGFRAFTAATPTVLVAHTSSTNELLGASILTPADAAIGGTVISVQSTFVGDASSTTLRQVYARRGLDALATTLGDVIGAGFTSTVALDASSWASLMGDDLPLSLTVRTDLIDIQGDVGRVVVSAGTREFAGEEITQIASHQNPTEPSLGVTLRLQELWRAWISQTTGSDGSGLTQVDAELATVFEALASGEVSFRTIPTATLASDPPESTNYLANAQPIRELFAQIVPFPSEVTPGDRPSVLLLDSTGGEVDNGPFVEMITLSGGRVTILGNATGSPALVNRVQFHDPVGSELARVISNSLGGPEPEDVLLEDATTSVTVIIGAPLEGS